MIEINLFEQPFFNNFTRPKKKICLKPLIFNGGEIHSSLDVKLSDLYNNQVEIFAKLENSNDIMELLMVTDALRRCLNVPIYVTIPYFPYARQDRVNSVGESLSVKVMADLINSQNYKLVTIWDPHSDVTPALLNNCKIVEQSYFVSQIDNLDYNTVLVAPDQGASKKIKKLAQKLNLRYIICDKTRDTNTGELSAPVFVSGHEDLTGDENFLIVDDICDGGRTFLNLVPVIRNLYTVSAKTKISLYVTHGIFSQGLGVFENIFHKIYCPNVFSNVESNDILKKI